MNKRDSLRQRVWLKFDKHCAYCGKVLEYRDMQVDHVEPLAFAPFPWDKSSKVYSLENLMPSCRRCNHYKRTRNLEQFRLLIKTLHERVSSQYITRVAIDYGIVEVKLFSGTFYFERQPL